MSNHSDDTNPIHGLVDARRAAAMLGVSINVFKVWASRSHDATVGVAAAMPKPIARLNGQVYLATEIEEFGRLLAMSQRSPRSRQRSLGSYFTPDSAAQLMVSWAIRDPADILLEPSLGDGRFARAAQGVAVGRGWKPLQLHGCEIDPEAAALAVSSGAVTADLLHVGDFLAAGDIPPVDLVVGNPPYVRMRELSTALRTNAEQAIRDVLQQEMDPAGSVWMPFVAKSVKHLKVNGRLALVLPLDFTYVRYARPLWDLLGCSFGRIRVVRCRERVFPDILQNVLILMAEGKGQSTSQVELVARDRLADVQQGLDEEGVPIPIDTISRGERGFQHALLPRGTRDVLSLLEQHSGRADERVKFNIGYVSGNKTFFHPSDEVVRRYRLPQRSLRPTAATSRDLARKALCTDQMEESAHLWLPDGKLTKGEQEYVAQGELEGVDMAFKCRIRKPWYVVPGVKTPDFLLTTFSDLPRLHVNNADWTASNSVLGGFLRSNNDADSFVDSWYTPLTLLSAEMEVHSLGGGVMVAVPREADSVLVLNKDATKRANRRHLDSALRKGNMEDAYAVGAPAIVKLVGAGGLEAVQRGIETLAAWRKAQVS